MTKDDRTGRILLGRYRLRRRLGAGAHGVVYLAEDLGRGGGHVAFKLVENIVGGARREDADDVLRWFRHPSWAAILDAGSLGSDAWFQVTRYVPGRSLDHAEGPQPPEFVWRFLEDGARVLGTLHRHGVIHYDVAPGNWIASQRGSTPHFVLTDGGLAHLGPVSGFARGTPQFMAPEVTEDGGHDHRADLYSLGLVAFRLATGRDPFEGGAGDVLGRRRRDEAPQASTVESGVPPALDALLADLLARDPNARPQDAAALLRRIGAASGREVAPFLHEEGISVAEGGPLVGREDELQRYRISLLSLAQRLPSAERTETPRPAPRIEDAALFLRGAPGCGTTRLAAEMASMARDEEVPVLLMSGRETSADRRGPLRHLVDGAASLGLAEGEEPEEVRLELGGQRSVGRAERTHAASRAIEQFVHAVEAAARRSPFVLIIEDFADLPERTQEAVVVLARHLLSRRESGGASSAIPVLLVVDAGSAEIDRLLIPDAQDPERPIVELPDLAVEDLKAMCGERFPGFLADRADLERIAQASEGRPGVLVALLGEACRRGDLSEESGRWHWKTDRLDEYEIERGMSPGQADALRGADEQLLRVLRYLSLVDTPLDEAVLRTLLGMDSEAVFAASRLIRTVTRGEGTRCALASLAVKQAVRARIPEEVLPDLARELLAALDEQDSPETALDRAQLQQMLGCSTAALSSLYDCWPKLPNELQAAAQLLIRRATEACPETYARPTGRARISKMLQVGPAAVEVATVLAGALGSGAAEYETAERLSELLEDARAYRQALRVINSVEPADLPRPTDAASLLIRRARLLHVLQRVEEARPQLRAARGILRQINVSEEPPASLLTHYYAVSAERCYLRNHAKYAEVLLLAAATYAKKARSAALRALVLNDLGIVYHRLGKLSKSRRQLERARSIRQAIGDVDGIVKTTLNLGRVHHFEGAFVKSTSLYQSAAAVALRHGKYTALSRALRFLARIYDQQLNTRLAATTLERAVQVASSIGSDVASAMGAWELAPMAAALGERTLARRMLLQSAVVGRRRRASHVRATHHFSAALVATHLGLRDRAALCMRRAARYGAQIAENRRILGAMRVMLGGRMQPEAARLDGISAWIERPARNDISRALYRGAVWMLRAARGGAAKLPPHPLSRLLHQPVTRALTPGRDRRLLVEMGLVALEQHGAFSTVATLDAMERLLAQTGEHQLGARLLALRSVSGDEAGRPQQAQAFSRSVELLESQESMSADRRGSLSHEHALASQLHAETLGIDVQAPASVERDLHAMAHRLLTRSGCTALPDRRVSSALRRVLNATGRMNAGAGLSELLRSITQDIMEITGAERTCVVLVGDEDDPSPRVATSSDHMDLELQITDLSHTVIQRVLDQRIPLLLHDVFDDHELMGRPSITSLSLRSILCVPMARGETLYGVLYADSAGAAGSFDSVDQEVLSLFAEHVAGALETHRLVTDLQNSMDELRATQERLVKGERLRTMGELSSGVAHEFNNLLTSILARVQLISLGHLAPELRDDLKMIERACLDAAQVVRRLQSYARREREGQFVVLDLGDVCRDAVEFLRPLWSTRRRHGREPIHVKLEIQPHLRLRGDPTELREVMTNLIKNALDALEAGGRINITATRSDRGLQVVVQDTGGGIPSDVLTQVFDPFYTTKGERGTGLGLCLSQQIVERHGGGIAIASSPGNGTVVTVELPSHADAGRLDSDASAPLPQDEPSPLKVLVVDDDENVRGPLSRFLERCGYAVVSAASGQEGLSAIENHQPDVVISDVNMPDMDGLELCRRARSQAKTTPVILMSGWANGIDAATAESVGALALVEKPFALQEIVDLLESVAQSR